MQTGMEDHLGFEDFSETLDPAQTLKRLVWESLKTFLYVLPQSRGSVERK